MSGYSQPTKILQQSEIDAILHGISNNEVGLTPEEVDDSAIRKFSFNQERIVRGRMPTLEIINDRFASGFRVGLTTILRRAVELSSSDLTAQIVKFSQFTNSLPVPTSIHVFKSDVLRGHGLMVISAELVYAFLEVMLGAKSISRAKLEGRDFTQIEYRLLKRIIEMALVEMTSAWKQIHPIQVSLVRSESNPGLAAIVAPTELVILNNFDFCIDDVVGRFHIIIPYSMIEPIKGKLYAGFQSDQLEKDVIWSNRFIERVKECKVNMRVKIGTAVISTETLLNMEVGDVLMLNANASEPLELEVQDIPKFLVAPGISRGQRAVKIIRDIPPVLWDE
jgi:flagellar motor switch protein FliM